MKNTRGHKTSASPYITPEGRKRFVDELSYLWKTKRPEVIQAVSEAAAMGDRSENAEYIYGKKQLRQIDSRMRFLQSRLNEIKVVDRAPEDTSKAFFGAWATIEDEEGLEFQYRIVGLDEISSVQNY
ncbi:transcription elongation factor GreB, partial [bacterium]|nr:transcription elongation factor GreB [bacterium]